MRSMGHDMETAHDLGTGFEFNLAHARFIAGREVWLALDDAHCDSRRISGKKLPALESLSVMDLETYQKQLFYWLLIRGGPGIFPQETVLRQGVPALIAREN